MTKFITDSEVERRKEMSRLIKVRCINNVGYNDVILKRFVDYNDEIEVDEERAKYLVEVRGLCERVEEEISNVQDDKQDESEDKESTNESKEIKENKKGKK